MTRKEMMDNVTKKYGFEAPQTIAFCVACEDSIFSYNDIITIYNSLM